jgi:hypothetical protein
MQHMVFSVLQTILILTIFLWIIALGLAVILQRYKQYFQWTSQTLQTIWKNAWQLIVGIAIGYWLCGAPLLEVGG